MISVLHITSCMSKKEFRIADTEKRVAMLLEQYEESIEKKYRPYWSDNWKKSLSLVYELVDMEFKFTNLLYTETTWGNPGYNCQYLNLEPIKHNPEFVKQIIALQSIWDSRDCFQLVKLGRRMDNDAIEKSVQLFYEKNPEMGIAPDYSIVTSEEIRFFDISICNWVLNNGGINMRTETRKLKVLIY